MKPSIQARIERYASSEIRFNLMAIVADRRTILREHLQACLGSREMVYRAHAGSRV